MSQIINLVADIGGTNIRLGTFEQDSPVTDLKVYQCGNYPSLSAVIHTYINEANLTGKTINACLAIACPVENDLISMTNLPWEFSQKALKEELSLNTLLLINDYTAIAHAVPYLSNDQKVQIGGGEVVSGKPISICGPGTGLGVANVVPLAQGQWQALGGEGGHVDFAPIDQTEIQILDFLLNQYQHVSYEQLLSGLGLEQIYQALNHIEQAGQPQLSAKDISAKALSNTCKLCEKSLAQFCKILGSFAGNLSLTLASFGGVYIAGGIVPRFIDYLKQSEFRSRFESKGRITFNQTIPTFVITESQPGILGASAYLRQHNLQNKG
ncbi:glucokinase [Colwellia sp. 1_MG-2023]|uniref:glucokinase n=1 Tax=Colwellia sp. 1_MG-2023 TaxID=3062649 RepID=UPI0026E16876|nr:glucokinase [Colwellia sp. 1_MG-2023]MDO6446009.1 glucokinase [Colwellia sp. 1_MG-2023]